MRSTTLTAVLASLLLPAALEAGAEIKISETKSVSVGGGLRTSINFIEDGSEGGNDLGKKLLVENARLYLNAQIAKGIFAEFNTEYDTGNADALRILDALVKFEYTKGFKVWAGRLLPPSDRANLDGPFFQPVWDYPFVSAFPAVFAGRDNGVAVWGEIGERFKYQAGAFQGAPNESDKPLWAGRLVYNFMDPEHGYYNSSTYYGTKKVLAVAVTAQAEQDRLGSGTPPSVPADFTGLEADVLFDYPLGGGSVLTLEGAVYRFRYETSPFPLIDKTTAFYVQGAYLFPKAAGPGKLQPVVRYQSADRNLAGADRNRLDVGLNYIIDGDSARIQSEYGRLDAGGTTHSEFKVGVQLQF